MMTPTGTKYRGLNPEGLAPHKFTLMLGVPYNQVAVDVFPDCVFNRGNRLNRVFRRLESDMRSNVIQSLLRLYCLFACIIILCEQAEAGLLLHYSFDDPSNIGADNSGHGHNATNNGVSFFAAGNRGGAASFNGTSSFLTAPLDVGITTMPRMTWGAWVKPTSTTTVRYPFLSNDDGGFDRQLTIAQRNGSTPSWAAHVGTGIYISTASPSLTEWSFVAAVYDNSLSSMNLYVNGTQFIIPTGFQSPSQSNFNIGTNTDFNRFFAGYLDDIFVFDTALTSSEIASIRVNGITAIPEPCSAIFCAIGFGGVANIRRKRVKPSSASCMA